MKYLASSIHKHSNYQSMKMSRILNTTLILTPYFCPGNSFKKALRRGKTRISSWELICVLGETPTSYDTPVYYRHNSKVPHTCSWTWRIFPANTFQDEGCWILSRLRSRGGSYRTTDNAPAFPSYHYLYGVTQVRATTVATATGVEPLSYSLLMLQ